MDIKISNILAQFITDESPVLRDITMTDDGESLYINVIGRLNSSCIILDKKQLVNFKSALDCFIKSDLIEDFQDE